MVRRDAHHILHNRQEWTLRPDGARLRESRTLIPRIDRSVHDEIHATCPPVPVLGFYALRRTAQLYEPGDTTMESMDNLMLAIEEAVEHPKTYPLERELASLVVRAIDLQRPILREALK